MVHGKAFGNLKFMKKPSFGASKSFALIVQSMQGENNGEEENRVMKIGDTAAVFHCTFGALPEVHFLHSIYHFKAQKVKNPTIQTMYDLELK